ncbi:MAG: outer-membrane lipoprotein carrier protein LolA [Treponema sp.]|nr:outer-membrane lipoprotein carrier protein LolA [Treponema sp.]
MKKLKILLTGLMMLVGTSGIFALELETVCDQLSKNPVTRGDFVQKKSITTARGTRELKSNGNYVFCADGIMWKTEKPFPSSMVVTKTRIVQTAADGKETVIDGRDNQTFASIASAISAIFSNDLKLLQETFNISFLQFKSDASAWEMLLEAKDSTISSVMTKMSVKGTSINNHSDINSITLYEASANTITYEFSNQKYSKELSSDEKNIFFAQ